MIENMIGHGTIDLPLSLCFAAIRGDGHLMHRLLKRGLDPNESENGGRTALVCSFFFPQFFKTLHRSVGHLSLVSD